LRLRSFGPDSVFQGIDLGANVILAGVNGRLALWLQFSGGSGLLGLAPLLFIFAIFYFLLILPQQRKQKKWQAMLSELKTGDKIVTTGGLRGTIISLKDDAVILRVPPDNLKLEVSRASVVSVATAEETK
jgi:preprotein translocase subunit YajC